MSRFGLACEIARAGWETIVDDASSVNALIWGLGGGEAGRLCWGFGITVGSRGCRCWAIIDRSGARDLRKTEVDGARRRVVGADESTSHGVSAPKLMFYRSRLRR